MQTVNRRDIAKLLACLPLLAGSGSLSSCEKSGTSDDLNLPTNPFDALRAFREMLRKSEDHLLEHSKRLVAGRDLNAISKWVSESIGVYPSSDDGFGDFWSFARSSRWGVEGALRYGVATPAEKVHLAARLLKDAGFKASVRQIHAPVSINAQKRLLKNQPAILPTIMDDPLLKQFLKMNTEKAVKVVDPDNEAATSLSEELLGVLDNPKAETFEFQDIDQYPVVIVESDNGPKVVDVLLNGGAVLDDAYEKTGRTINLALSPRLNIKMMAQYTGDRYTRAKTQTLVQGTWRFDQIVGHQINAQLTPVVDILKGETPAAASIFAPALMVEKSGMSKERQQELSVTGDFQTLSGKRIRVDEKSGTVSVEGVVLPTASTADVKSASSVKLKVRTAHHPNIAIDFNVLDDKSEPLKGFAAGDFNISVSGKPVPFTLTRAQAAPRIKVLVDQSLSVPIEFRVLRSKETVAKLETALRADYPNARIEIQATESDLWTEIAAVSVSEYDHVVYITDGEPTDQYDKKLDYALTQAPSISLLLVNKPVDADFAKALGKVVGTKLGVFVVSDQVALESEILSKLKEKTFFEYGVELRIPMTAKNGDPVEISLTEKPKVLSSTPLIVPDGDRRSTARQLIGLWLEVKIIGDRASVVHLAGYHPQLLEQKKSEPELIDETYDSLFGQNILSIEGKDPLLSVWLDDLVTAKINLEEAAVCATCGDKKDVFEALGNVSPSHLTPDMFLVQALPAQSSRGETSVVVNTGLSAVLVQQRAIIANDTLLKRTDIVPIAKFKSVSADAQTAFKDTLLRSSQRNIVESSVYSKSALSELSGKHLVVLSKDILAGFEPALSRKWQRRMDGGFLVVTTSNGLSEAWWQISPKTGEVLGFLEGTGGSALDYVINYMLIIDQALGMADAYAAVVYSGNVPTTVSLIICWGRAVALTMAHAARSLAYAGTNLMETTNQDVMIAIVCNFINLGISAAISSPALNVLFGFASLIANLAPCMGADPEPAPPSIDP